MPGYILVFMLLRICFGQDDETTTPEIGEPDENTSAQPRSRSSTIANATGPPPVINATKIISIAIPKASTHAPKDCVNLHPLCSYWKFFGQCDSNEDFMKFYCRKSCRKCDTVPSSIDLQIQNKSVTCSDDYDLCVFWSKRDQCNRNFYWMLRHCPFSCGYCSTKCRPCPPPPDTPPGLNESPKLFQGNTNLLGSNGRGQLDFTNYQPNIPPSAFGLHGDPFINYHNRRSKRDRVNYPIPKQQPQTPRSNPKHHAHGSGIGWTDLPPYGSDCKPKTNKCVTQAPLPCCIPVALADALGLLPLGAYVTPETPSTESPGVVLALVAITNETPPNAALQFTGAPVVPGVETRPPKPTSSSTEEETEPPAGATPESQMTSTEGGAVEEAPSIP